MTTETKTRERPILMSGPLVREILAGRKTQTRRPVKRQGNIHGPCSDGSIWWIPSDMQGDMEPNAPQVRADTRCPYGAPGDRLWVRETWRLIGWDWDAPEARIRYRADETALTYRTAAIDENWLEREADRIEKTPGVRDDRAEGAYDSVLAWDDENALAWRPGIHMPRWACRLVLEVQGIRVERLHEITEEDARAEGVADRAAFQAKWVEIYGAESWDANPWVWVISFRRMP